MAWSVKCGRELLKGSSNLLRLLVHTLWFGNSRVMVMYPADRKLTWHMSRSIAFAGCMRLYTTQRLVERLAKDDDKIASSLSLIENLAHRARINPGPAGGETYSFALCLQRRSETKGSALSGSLPNVCLSIFSVPFPFFFLIPSIFSSAAFRFVLPSSSISATSRPCRL